MRFFTVVLFVIYIIVHPCLSFDPISDSLGECRESDPATCYVVAGTQAERLRDNTVILMKLENLRKNKGPDAFLSNIIWFSHETFTWSLR